jgi:hypothetical protein
MPRFSRFAAAAAAVVAASFPLPAAEPAPAIPDERAFFEQVKENLKSDETLLEQYTFTETYVERRLDGKGGVKKARHETYEVYPSLEPGKLYRRLVARDGKPLSEKELAEQDRKQEAKTEKRERRLADEDDAARARRLARKEENRRKEKAVIDELFQMDEIRIAGREMIDGREAVIVTFKPRPGFKPVTQGGKIIQKIEGTAWVDTADRELVRLETRLVDNLGVGPGRLARLQRGAHGYFQRRKVNGEIWLPESARFEGAARVLLLFCGRLEISSQYGDYKKFSVGTEEQIVADPESGN